MKRSSGQIARAVVTAVILALAVPSISLAQGRGAGGPPGGGGPGGGMGGPQFPGPGGAGPNGGPGSPGMGGNQPHPGQGGPPPDGRPGFQFGPPGRWWDDRGVAKSLKLRPEQQTRMDAIFEQNRGALLARFETVHQAEAQMEELARSPAPDEAALFAQIDRVAQARAELDKVNTHMLLQIRKEMDPDQIKKLEKQTQR